MLFLSSPVCFAAGSLLGFLLATHAIAEEKCSRDWLNGGKASGKLVVYGIGSSAEGDGNLAREQARTRALRDIAMQLRSNVKASMSLTESEVSTAFAGDTKVGTNIESIVGAKVLKEAVMESEGEKIQCAGMKLDVVSAYEFAKSGIEAGFSGYDELQRLARLKKWQEVLKSAKAAREKLNGIEGKTTLADIYRAYLGEPGETFTDRYANASAAIDKLLQKARSEIVVVMASSGFQYAQAEVSSQLKSIGISVVRNPKEAAERAVKLAIEISQQSMPIKSQTALGLTVTVPISVIIKDLEAQKEVGSNRGIGVVGTSRSSYEEALTNVDRQLVAHIMDALRNSIPGAF
jgi:hypothetical protein